MLKKLLVLLPVLMLLMGAHAALAAYNPQGPIPVPRIAQRDTSVGGPGGDCYVCSLASVQAYYAGKTQYTYGSYSRTYSGVGDYDWSTDPFWREIYALNGNSVWIAGTTCGKLPFPMSGSSYSVSSSLSVIYNQLQKGNPVTIHSSTNGAMHASVIIGYKGKNATTLKTSDFIVMEIKRWNSNGYTGGLNSQALFNACMTSPISKTTVSEAQAAWKKSNSQCYYTLQSWLLKTFSSENIDVNLRWVTNPPNSSLKVMTEHAVEAMDVTLQASGTNKMVAYQYPYSASAEMTGTLAAGTKLRIVSSVYNSYNNLWYRTSDGRYIYSAIAKYSAGVPNLRLSGFTLSGEYAPGTLPAISGTLTSDSCITDVTVKVLNGGNVVLQDSCSVMGLRTTNLSLSEGLSLNLNALPGGNYTLVFTVAYGTHGETKDLSYSFSVASGEPESIRLSAPDTIQIGDMFFLSADVLPENCPDKTLRYTSSNPTIATVNSKGRVTVMQVGTFTITATAVNGISSSITLTAGHNLDSVSLLVNGLDGSSGHEAAVLKQGESLPYTLNLSFTNGYEAPYFISLTSESSCLSFDEQNQTLTGFSGGEDRIIANIGAEINGDVVWLLQAFSCPVFVMGDSMVFDLPEALSEIDSQAFEDTAAREVRLHEKVSSVASGSFPSSVRTVYVDQSEGLTIEPDAFAAGTAIVDLSPSFNLPLRAACVVYGYRYFFNGECDGVEERWSDWSEWSTKEVTSDENTQVETRIQYSTAPITISYNYTSTYTPWSAWTDTRKTITDARKTQEETRTVYHYYYFLCSKCGAHMHLSTQCYTWAGGCGSTGTLSWREGVFLPVTKSQCSSWHGTGKYYTMHNGNPVFYYGDAPTVSKKQYRYRDCVVETVTSYGTYSAWSDTPATPSDTLAVRTRTLYRSRTRLP